jgi:elongation factor G
MRCFTVVGPSQTGKTTVVDKLGSLEGIPKKSSSPHGLNFTEFTFLNEPWCALDAPGAIESLPHAQHALLASDACILCVSPVPEEAVLAAPYLRMIEASGTPCILFVNRMDEPRGRLRDVIAALQDYASHTLLLRQIPIREGDKVVGSCDLISERAWRYREGQTSALIAIPETVVEREHEARAELLEHLSEFDDWLLEELVEDREPPSDALYAISARVLRENKIIPVMIGAASHNNGMMRLMKALRHEAPPVESLRKQARCGELSRLLSPERRQDSVRPGARRRSEARRSSGRLQPRHAAGHREWPIRHTAGAGGRRCVCGGQI